VTCLALGCNALTAAVAPDSGVLACLHSLTGLPVGQRHRDGDTCCLLSDTLPYDKDGKDRSASGDLPGAWV
jgi:hypothetical protein